MRQATVEEKEAKAAMIMLGFKVVLESNIGLHLDADELHKRYDAHVNYAEKIKTG